MSGSRAIHENSSYSPAGSGASLLARSPARHHRRLVRWIGLRGPTSGIANVFLDGAFHARVDTYSPTEIQGVVFTITGLAPASHTVTIETTGEKNPRATGSVIVVDAFDLRARVEERDASVRYTGTWTQEHMDRAWSGTSANTGSGTAALSATEGALAEFTFSGTEVSWIGFRGPVAGMADVFLDGGFVRTVDLYAATEELRVPIFTVTDLPEGDHGLRIRVTGTRNPAASAAFVVVDAFDVMLPASSPPVSRVQQTDPTVTYTGGWTQSAPNSLFSGQTVASTSTARDRARSSPSRALRCAGSASAAAMPASRACRSMGCWSVRSICSPRFKTNFRRRCSAPQAWRRGRTP